MPMIKIQFDDTKIKQDEVLTLSNAVQKIVSDTTEIEDVFVYGDSSEIKVNIAPIEIFVEMSASKINDADALLVQIKTKLSEWKKENNFPYPINLTLIPMNWMVEVNI